MSFGARTRLATLATVAIAVASALAFSPSPGPVPALVFAARHPPADRRLILGLGPSGRTLATGGRLMVRWRNGQLTPLLPDAHFFDVSDPAVSWDAHRIAFAATVAPESVWRIWTVDADGRHLARLTLSNRSLDFPPTGAPGAPVPPPLDAKTRARLVVLFARYDDFDPCWLPDGRICFASTRFPQIAEERGLVVSNLFVVKPDGSDLKRITTDRNGAEEPTVDPTSGRIVYARWWLNRYRASDRTPSGLTTSFADAAPADTVNLWHAISVFPDGEGIRLAGGDARSRLGQMAYQPAMLSDTTLVGIRAEHGSLSPNPGRTYLQAFTHGFAPARTLTGEGESAGSRACAPVTLPDGRILFSFDRQGAGDFGLWVIGADGLGLAKLLELPGMDALDAAVLAPRRRPPVIAQGHWEPTPALPNTRVEQLKDLANTFRFDCLSVFANGPVDSPFPDAPLMQLGMKMRFFGTLSRPEADGGDSAVLVREVTLTVPGAIHEDELPADTPLFEQLIDAHGHVVRSAGGPAHVPGLNYARFGSGTKCVGCHAGHSALFVAESAALGGWVNASPSAHVEASSVAPGTAGAHAAVDRRANGAADSVAWVSEGLNNEWLRLTWQSPIEVRAIILYGLGKRPSEGTDLKLRECELVLEYQGHEVQRTRLSQTISPSGTRVAFNSVRIDCVEVHPLQVTGRVLHRSAAALAEIETIARLVSK